MKFTVNYEMYDKKVYDAKVVAVKLNGVFTAYPTHINGVEVKTPPNAQERYFLCYEDITILEMPDNERYMEVEF